MYGSSSAATFGHRKEESVFQREPQMSSGLLRFSSAPSSLLGDACEGFLPARPSSPESDSLLARFLASTPRDAAATAEQNGGYSSISSQLLYHQQPPPPPPPIAGNAYREVNQTKSGGGNLIRQSSSPAGLLSHLNADSGYGLMGGIPGSNRNGMRGEFKRQINFSSRQNSLSQISEMGSDGISCAWEDSFMSDSKFDGTELQNGAGGLTHHFSLPKTGSEMAAIEKLLHFQDSVPCKIRAKRGCATHPRSIAERVRRTRISERMRKLQELVPNMDKQTNTADMLDLAVEYIKDLQNQVKSLSDVRATCSCAVSRQKPYQSQAS